MFGRKSKPVDDVDEVVDDADVDEAAEDDGETVDGGAEVSPNDEPDDSTDEGEDDDVPAGAEGDDDEWVVFDGSRDWREDGPFDISEVDLDADDVQRLDFGSLIVTPFDNMQMQLQINQASGQVQALLVVDGKSAIEVALFAAPARGSMLAQVREEMTDATEKAGGTMTLVEGPLGTEVRRVLPVTTPDGKQAKQPSRTWLAQGPKWLLRGVLMGNAAGGDETEEAQLLFEFFCNLVVRRGDVPKVPGELIGLDIPASLAANLPGQTAK